MGISSDKIKLVTNRGNDIQREDKVKRQKLDMVASFKYIGAIVSDEG